MTTLTYAGDVREAPVAASFAARVRILATRLAASRKARRDFESLRGSSDHLLADIGLTRGELSDALAAPFWANPGDRLARRGR